MDFRFTESTERPERFFAILPRDWRRVIAPCWEDYRGKAKIFILESAAEEVLGGGIVFSAVSPDARAYEAEAQHWFDLGYLYIGFLWVAEEHRGKRLGSKWLVELRKKYPGQKFWLAIDDYVLLAFYESNGFRLVGQVDAGAWEEWILIDG